MADLKALNRRKYLTGRELGILEVENLCEVQRYNNDFKEGRKYNPVIKDQEKFKAKLRLLSADEGRVYDKYIQLHHWLLEESNEAGIYAREARDAAGELASRSRDSLTGQALARYKAKWQPSEEEYGDLPPVFLSAKAPASLLDEAGALTGAGQDAAEWNELLWGNVIAGIYWVRGYNYALERIAALLDVSGAVYFKQTLAYVDADVQEYHKNIEHLKEEVKKDDNAGAGLKAVKALYKPIREKDIGDLDEDARAQIDALITSFDGFYGQSRIVRFFRKAVKG